MSFKDKIEIEIRTIKRDNIVIVVIELNNMFSMMIWMSEAFYNVTNTDEKN